jgi:glucose-1-phosphate thymidylyltransferase
MSRDFINREPVAMVLGDNLFHGNGFSSILINATDDVDNANVFLYSVKDPSRYGVGKFNDNNNLIDVIEKPTDYISSWAVTGLYMFPGDVADRAASLKPSPRGETEITDLIRTYINEGRVKSNCLARGNVWFDVGTPDSLLQASLFVEMMQNRQNILIASPEEIAWRMGMITQQNYIDLISTMPKSQYRNALELTLIP